MDSRMTPQQCFENAGCLLVRAAAVKECAEELQAHVTAMHLKMHALQSAASDMQKRGVDNRRHLDHALVKTLQDYGSILSKFRDVKPEILDKISLAVEEGRASTEQVERFALELHEFSLSHDCNKEPVPDKHKKKGDEDLRDTLLASISVKPVRTIFDELETDAEASQISTSDLNDNVSDTANSDGIERE